MVLSARILRSAGQLLWEQRRLARGHNATISKRTKDRRRRITDCCTRALKWFHNAARLTGVGQENVSDLAAATVRILADDAGITAWLQHPFLADAAQTPQADLLDTAMSALLGHDNAELGVQLPYGLLLPALASRATFALWCC